MLPSRVFSTVLAFSRSTSPESLTPPQYQTSIHLRYHPVMRSVRTLSIPATTPEDVPARVSDPLPLLRLSGQGRLLTTLGWISAGAGTLGLGLIVGRELRRRYKFKRRTPYDLYAHAGDYNNKDVDFGVGI